MTQPTDNRLIAKPLLRIQIAAWVIIALGLCLASLGFCQFVTHNLASLVFMLFGMSLALLQYLAAFRGWRDATNCVNVMVWIVAFSWLFYPALANYPRDLYVDHCEVKAQLVPPLFILSLMGAMATFFNWHLTHERELEQDPRQTHRPVWTISLLEMAGLFVVIGIIMAPGMYHRRLLNTKYETHPTAASCPIEIPGSARDIRMRRPNKYLTYLNFEIEQTELEEWVKARSTKANGFPLSLNWLVAQEKTFRHVTPVGMQRQPDAAIAYRWLELSEGNQSYFVAYDPKRKIAYCRLEHR